jgi:hypothetical protein
MQIGVLTIFSNEFYNEIGGSTLSNTEEYCKTNDYEFFGMDISGTTVCHGYNKIECVKHAFESGKADIILGLDLDVLITNHKILIEDFTNKKKDFYITKDVNGINAGTFIIKKSDLMMQFLSEILTFQHSEFSEQDIIEKLIFREEYIDKVEILPHPSINSYLYDEYGPNYGKIIGVQKNKPTHNEGQWEEGNFILHLPGIPNKRRVEIFENIKPLIKK